MKEIQGKLILVKVSARFEFAMVQLPGVKLLSSFSVKEIQGKLILVRVSASTLSFCNMTDVHTIPESTVTIEFSTA